MENKVTVKLVFVFCLSIAISFYTGFNFPKEETQKNFNYIDKIVYHNEDNKTTMRFKYIMSYETIDKELKSKLNGEPVYSLYIDNKLASEAYESREVDIPSVSESFSVNENDIVQADFEVRLNSKLNRNTIRTDVKIIIEDLKEGKWVPVYQVVFMERGPYWSLDRGPIETIEIDERD